jgi:hypothetical protein
MEKNLRRAGQVDRILKRYDSTELEVLEDSQENEEASEESASETEPEAGEPSPDELNLAASVLDKSADPVRMYLREMGAAPLLTREGEVEIAKRIERGRLAVRKAVSRCPLIVKEVLTIGGHRPLRIIIRCAGCAQERGPSMEETKIDRETMGRLAKVLSFIGNPDDPVVVALRQAAETGTERDIRQARTLFLKLRSADRRAALAALVE